MRPRAGFGDERPVKRQKLQQSITNMLGLIGPKFVEVAGVQLLCPYCHHKFRAPQGLVAHKHMHERAGHRIQKQRKLKFERPLESLVPAKASPIRRPEKLVGIGQKEKLPKSPSSVKKDLPAAKVSAKNEVMTRRFTVSEKLQIIEKAKELKNLSATCR